MNVRKAPRRFARGAFFSLRAARLCVSEGARLWDRDAVGVVLVTALGAVACGAVACGAVACGADRDVIPPSKDVHGGRAERGYGHVARRPFGAVALAESQGIPAEFGRAAIEKLADSLERCAEDLAREGKLASGAARVTASLSRDGAVSTVALTVSPGAAPKANALLCLVSPAKLLAFPPTDDRLGSRVFVAEAVWGPPEVDEPDTGSTSGSTSAKGTDGGTPP